MLMLAWQACIFSQTYDTVIRNAVKGNKKPSELMEYAGIVETVTSLQEMVEKEANERDTAKALSNVDNEDGGLGTRPKKANGFASSDGAEGTDGAQGVKTKSSVCNTLSPDRNAYWHALVQRTVRANVTFLPEQKTAMATRQILAPRKVTSMMPAAGTYMIMHYNIAEAGESATAPHIRSPPFNADRFSGFVSGVLQARGDEGKIQPRDIFMVNDNGKPGPPGRFCMRCPIVVHRLKSGGGSRPCASSFLNVCRKMRIEPARPGPTDRPTPPPCSNT